MAIIHIKHKGLKELFETGRSAKIRPDMKKNVLRILDAIDGVHSPDDLQGFKDFHPLIGNRKGTYSLHVNKNFCITFLWDGSDAYDVTLEDYH